MDKNTEGGLAYLDFVNHGVDEDLADGVERPRKRSWQNLLPANFGAITRRRRVKLTALRGVEVDTLKVNLYGSLVGGGKGTLGTLASSEEMTECMSPAMTLIARGQERHIEGSSSEIEDEDVALALVLLVETVGNGGHGGLVDDTEDVDTSDHTGILGSGTLGVVEVGRDGDDVLGDGGSKIGFLDKT